MKKIIYLLPGILITLFHLLCNFLLEEKITIKDTLLYYLKVSIIINLVMILIMNLEYKKWLWEIRKLDSIAPTYIIYGSILGLFIPYILYKFNHNEFRNAISKYEILKIDFHKENIKKYFQENRSTKLKLLFFTGSIIFFFVLDFFLRKLSSQTANFYDEFLIAPNIITITFAIVFTYLIYYLPRKTSKVFYFLITIFY